MSEIRMAQRVAELESEIARLKKLSRCHRRPVAGIGGTIQRLREKFGLSLTELANRADVSKGFLSHVERTPDVNVGLAFLAAIAIGLGTDISVLILDYEDEIELANKGKAQTP